MNLTPEECEVLLFLLNGYGEKLYCKDKEYTFNAMDIVGKLIKCVAMDKVKEV